MVSKGGLLTAIAVAVIGYYIYTTKYGARHNPIPSPVVETAYGKLQGVSALSRDGQVYYQYLGIPYAKAPVGELRYESPQKPEKWTGVRDASKYGSECAQLNMLLGGNHDGSEDCLFLNVFTTDVKPKNGKLKPILVFIHGGAFVFGSSNTYRPDYFMDTDVILVTLNYRLASFGFLNTGANGLVRGNMGLKDQVQALRFIKENIAKFGGDPDQVTVVGESAGGASVHHLLLSPTTKGLFQRAISQSGVALSSWATKVGDSLKQAQRYASNAKCPTSDMKKMVDCLKGLTTTQLLDAHAESKGTLKDPITLFAPTIESVNDEHTFLAEHPAEILRKGKAHRLPWVNGYNSEEGLLASATVVRDEGILKKFDDDFAGVMPDFLQFDKSIGDSRVKDIMTQARDFYFGPDKRIDSIKSMENFTNIMTDYVWQHQLQHTALVQSEFSPVFTYYYSYKGKFTLTKVLLALKGKYPIVMEFLIYKVKEWIDINILGKEIIHYGTCHGDELALLFKMEGIYEINTLHEDYAMSKEIVKLWVDFASNANPLKFKGQEWLPLEKQAKSVKYIQLDRTSSIIDQPNPERVELWKKLLATKKN